MAGPHIRVQRLVEWADTDASGHYYNGAVTRWVEYAEWALLDRVGLAHLFGRTPRVHYEVDYLSRLWFGDTVDVLLWVDRVGTTSLRYAFAVYRAEIPAARGGLVLVNAHPEAEHAEAWSEEVRKALTAGP